MEGWKGGRTERRKTERRKDGTEFRARRPGGRGGQGGRRLPSFRPSSFRPSTLPSFRLSVFPSFRPSVFPSFRPKQRRRRHEMPPAELFENGGGGNRTLVRVSFQNHPYVRRRISLRRSEPAMHRPSRTLSPEISQLPSELRQPPARIFFQWRRPRRAPFTGGALSEREAQLTQPSPSSVLAVSAFQTVLPGTWTWARSDSFIIPVEASRPRRDAKYNRLVPTRAAGRFPPDFGPSASPPSAPHPPERADCPGCGWYPGAPPRRSSRSAARTGPASPTALSPA